MAVWGLLKRRVLIATIGALLVGSCRGAMAAQLAYPITAGGTILAGLTGSPTTSAAAGATDTATAPATATHAPPTPTLTPRPTPTPPIPGTLGQIHGQVASTPNTNSFTLQTRTGSFTVTVDSSTTITVNGAPAPLSSVTQGMQASIQGTWGSVTAIAASTVSAFADN
jgi:hypothetical protein